MGTRVERARAAGEVLYGSMSEPRNGGMHNATSAIHDHVETGADYQREAEIVMRKEPMSPLRRTFCLLVLFDVIIAVILFLIYAEVKSDGNTKNSFQYQIVLFTFKTSLFDTVLLAVFRFLVLQLFYAILRSKQPWFVAGTTGFSSVYLLCKVIFYKYAKAGDSAVEILEYIVIITSVVIAWVETWVMDLKVLPHEKKELERRAAADRTAQEYDERSPLLSRFLRPARTEESFYSPQPSDSDDSRLDSDGEDSRSFYSTNSKRRSRSHSLTSSLSQGTRYKSLITGAQKEALDLLDSDQWAKEAGTDDVGGIVYAKHTKSWGKVFKLVGEIDIDALSLYNDLVENASAMPKWNPTVLEVKALEFIDDNTEISYSVAAEGAAGMVSSRDFVCIRHWEQLDGWYITSSVSVEHPSMPPQSRYVRGENGPGVMRMKDIDSNKLRLEWLLNSNLKGWLPQYLIDQALSGVLMAYLENLKKYASTLSPGGAGD